MRKVSLIRVVFLTGLTLMLLLQRRTMPFLFLLLYEGKNDDCTATGSCTPQTMQEHKAVNTTVVTKNAPSRIILPEECPLAVRNAVGIYENGSSNQFSNAVLLTASNMDFIDTLHNWEIFAKSHGLKYAVLAMDDALFEHLGPARAVPSNTDYAISKIGEESAAENKKDYFTLVCNKMRLILQILQVCRANVIFSDADNVLLRDPFVHDLGKLMTFRRHRWDYLYTTNDAWTATPRSHDCITAGAFPVEGNTGFAYISATATWVHDIMQRSILKCQQKSNRRHDQTLFWKGMHKRRTEDWVQCDAETYRDLDNNKEDTIMPVVFIDKNTARRPAPSICCLDPHYYTVGAIRPGKVESLVSFHANYVKTQTEKMERLRDWVNGWRVAATNSSISTVLEEDRPAS